ncbi:MAG: deoxyribonuclease IV [Candidatus Omnitrophica bacterium]|nr:deoxyribonuclease IV [Candidatus Omnitrophota bacterium]
MRLGVHVPIAGGLLEAVERAKRLACSTMQIFSRSPRGGPSVPIPRELAQQFDRERRDAGIDPLAIHGPYIINLASPDPAMWRQSLRLYREEYVRAATLKAQYLVTHVGSHKGSGEQAGAAKVADALTQTLRGIDETVMVLLENTAGSGQGLGYQFEQLAAIRDQVNGKERVGICLDTAHLFAAGYPIHTAEGLEQTLAAFDRTLGFAHLKLIHLNDSHVPFDARVDRHWHIGKGHIGLEAFGRIVNHPKLKNLPFILETPKSTARPGSRESRAGDAEDRRNLAVVKKLVRSVHPSRRSRAHVS